MNTLVAVPVASGSRSSRPDPGPMEPGLQRTEPFGFTLPRRGFTGAKLKINPRHFPNHSCARSEDSWRFSVKEDPLPG
jgi:hypothetical protein